MRPIANFSILRMILIIFITLQAFDTCYAQVRQEWAARFNSRVDDSDYANAITVDRDGNIYVTGSGFGDAGHSDYVTLKYDSTGNQLWMARYSGGGCEYCSNGGVNYATAIALSVEGNVYVTGTGSSALDGMAEYATIKYDTNGNQLWVATYRGLLTTGSSVNHAKALTVDGQGNVYVTGTSFRSGGSEYDYMDYATVKYDGNGNEIWASRYHGPGGSGTSDSGIAVAVDEEGNVYVTGSSWGIGRDYATVKYDRNGQELWVVRYNGPGDGSDDATAIALDAGGNVYVTGGSYGYRIPYEYATIKYDTDGNEQWVARYNGPGPDFDMANAIAVDAEGNVYVTGLSNYASASIKYDNLGNELWVRRDAGYGRALTLDHDGNVYVATGSVIKYDDFGNQVWVYSAGIGDAIAVDSSGNVYVTGTVRDDYTGYDWETRKLAPSDIRIDDPQEGGGNGGGGGCFITNALRGAGISSNASPPSVTAPR